MINNFNAKNRKDDIKLLSIIISLFLFVLWLCSPPGNKFAQICFYGNNTQFVIAKLTKNKNDLNEWKFHRNNAIYLARMERKKHSLIEMDNAIKTVPSYMSDAELNALYADRGQLRLFWRDYNGALNDFLRIPSPNILDKFKIALLYKEKGNYREALSYCNSVINIDSTAYVGYACLADVYGAVGRYDVSVKVYDMLIDKVQSRAKYYADRAMYKRKCGDASGYQADMMKAKELSPNVETETSIVQDTLKPKQLTLLIM